MRVSSLLNWKYRYLAIKLFLYPFLCFNVACTSKDRLNRFSPIEEKDSRVASPIVNEFRFNGYTTHWNNVHQQRYRYGNALKLNVPDIHSAILYAKANVSEALGLTSLQLQEGFIHELLLKEQDYEWMDNPSLENLERVIKKRDVLLFADTTSAVGKILSDRDQNRCEQEKIGYQRMDNEQCRLNAFILKDGTHTIFAAVGDSEKQLKHFRSLLENLIQVITTYHIERGWFGVQTLRNSVTCTPGNPVDLIGQGLNEGNSWFIFDGYMEFLSKNEIDEWSGESKLPILTDVGFAPIYNCTDYENLQVQMMFKPQDWSAYATSKKGYLFGEVKEKDLFPFDGYFANPGNASQINNGKKPFVLQTGDLLSGTTSHMLLFIKKGTDFDKKALWNAIMDRQAVAISDGPVMMGDDQFRTALQLLFLDRSFLEDYFGDRVNMVTTVENDRVLLSVTNAYFHPIKGTLHVNFPPQLSSQGNRELSVRLKAGETKLFSFPFASTRKAMNRNNVVAFTFDWGGIVPKSTVAGVELPPAVSVHQLLYGCSSGINFPVSLYNFSDQDSIEINIKVIKKENPSETFFETRKMLYVKKGLSGDMLFNFQLPEGNYTVFTSALGITAETQLGVENADGVASVSVTDLDGDGIDEYILENEWVKVTLLSIGGRVIEYLVKEKNDNIFFKLWPNKPEDALRPYRERSYYPYGGFEDFLGQPSIETHKVYNATVNKMEGEYAQVTMSATYYGNVIEKTYTLFGNTPLLETRFSTRMINRELNMMGPQPIIELGKEHGEEDLFIFPEIGGKREYRMKRDRYYGRALHIAEGWNAVQDSKENIAFIGAFPVNRPIFLHLWMNHPSNPDAKYFYAEMQPWIPLFMQTSSYFSYYMWAEAGKWQDILDKLKKRNLITIKDE